MVGLQRLLRRGGKLIFIGIDPGLAGAVAFLPDGRAPFVVDMPVKRIGDGVVKNALDPHALSSILRAQFNEFSASRPRLYAFLERVNAFPGQGVSSMFSLGCSFWGAYSVLAALGIPATLVEPKDWKGFYKLQKDKGLAIGLARRLFPDVDLRLAKHHGRAEALLIAQYGKSTFQEVA